MTYHYRLRKIALPHRRSLRILQIIQLFNKSIKAMADIFKKERKIIVQLID